MSQVLGPGSCVFLHFVDFFSCIHHTLTTHQSNKLWIWFFLWYGGEIMVQPRRLFMKFGTSTVGIYPINTYDVYMGLIIKGPPSQGGPPPLSRLWKGSALSDLQTRWLKTVLGSDLGGIKRLGDVDWPLGPRWSSNTTGGRLENAWWFIFLTYPNGWWFIILTYPNHESSGFSGVSSIHIYPLLSME